jgi:periplasmic protein TonB
MRISEAEAERHFKESERRARRAIALQIGGVLLVASLAGAAYGFWGGDGKPESKPPIRVIQTVKLLPPPPPPPPPKPPEQKKVEELKKPDLTPVRTPMPRTDAPPKPTPVNSPLPPGPPITSTGPLGADSFGLLGGDGSGNGGGGDGGGGGGGVDMVYISDLQKSFEDALARDERTRYSDFRVRVRLKPGKKRCELLDMTRDQNINQAICEIYQKLPLPPPESMLHKKVELRLIGKSSSAG